MWKLWVRFTGGEWSLILSGPDPDALERFARSLFPRHCFNIV
jgi:hypothetical protein